MIKAFIEKFETTLRRSEQKEVARRERVRPHTSDQWLLPGEERQLNALASLILPSDEVGPGAADAKVTLELDKMLAASRPKQKLYAAGLASLDRWAQRERKKTFAELSAAEQLEVLQTLDSIYQGWSKEVSGAGKVQRKISALRLMRAGEYSAVEFFPRLDRDVMQIFYTSRVAWNWLGYDGPPMPQGYSDLWSARQGAAT